LGNELPGGTHNRLLGVLNRLFATTVPVTPRHSAATHLVEFRPFGILNRRFQGHPPEHRPS
jgi:hypothetical protein